MGKVGGKLRRRKRINDGIVRKEEYGNEGKTKIKNRR